MYDIINGKFRDLSYGYFFLRTIIDKFNKENLIYNNDNILPLINEIKYIKEDTIHDEIYIFLHGFKKEIGNKILNNKICQNINCINSFISLKDHPELYIYTDTHWNENGHNIVAKKIIEEISDY